MAAVPYTPTVFSKGNLTETATTWSQHWSYVFDGWTIGPVAVAAAVTVVPLKSDTLIASSRDHSGTLSAIAVGSYGLLPPRVAIPPTTRPIMIYYGANVACTAAGTGIIGIGIADISDGTTKQQAFASRGGTFASTGTFAPLLGSVEGNFELDPSTSWRFYRMVGAIFRDSGALAASMMSGASAGAPSYQPADRAAYIRAVLV